MKLKRVAPVLLIIFTIAYAAKPGDATTLVRAGLDQLSVSHEIIAMGEVVDAYSYWNRGGTFILTDVSVRVLDLVKGSLGSDELTITLMGGTVGDLTTLILGGAELIPGRPYVLFLDKADLPGRANVLTVPEHCQGVFDVFATSGGEWRAVSQANGGPLVADADGYIDAPGGVEGLSLDAMLSSILEITTRHQRDPRR